MSRSVRISMKAARVIGVYLDGFILPPHVSQANAELRQAMDAAALERAARPDKRKARRQETADIYEACAERTGGVCECGCGQRVAWAGDEHAALGEIGQLDHMFGRGKGRLPQSVETCWLLRTDCHGAKTRNEPDAATWWRKFIAHLNHHHVSGPPFMAAVARLAFVEVRASLPAAPRLKP